MKTIHIKRGLVLKKFGCYDIETDTTGKPCVNLYMEYGLKNKVSNLYRYTFKVKIDKVLFNKINDMLGEE